MSLTDEEAHDIEDYLSDEEEDLVSDIDYERAHPSNDRPLPQTVTLTPSDLDGKIEEEINDVMDVSGLEHNVVSILLHHFRWNKERLLETYMESPDEVLRESGISSLSNKEASSSVRSDSEPPTKRKRTTIFSMRRSQNSQKAPLRFSLRLRSTGEKNAGSTPQTISTGHITSLTTSSAFTCEVCCNTTSDFSDMYRAQCGHIFCKLCWSNYFQTKIEHDRTFNITCMRDGCGIVLSENELRKLLDDQGFARFRQLVRDSYVLQNKHLKFCPWPACAGTLRSNDLVDQTSILTVVPILSCSASSQLHTFCFHCETLGDHRPLICPLASKWTSQVQKDAGSVSWIIANTKACPQCRKPVEKNGGCNHMSCSQCHASWCWQCAKLIKVCKNMCNRFQPSNAQAGDPASKAREDLKKWLFYYDRYMNHEKSTKLEKELVDHAEFQIREIITLCNMSWVEARFMRDAVDVLKRCRETLKWSYGMAYFIQQANSKALFEDLQGDLEKAVEELSRLLEKPVTMKTIRELRRNILDKTAFVKKQHQLMLKDVAAGLQEDRWKWTVAVV